MATTFNVAASGLASVKATYSGPPANLPTNGDTIDTKGFDLHFDLQLTGTGVTLQNTGSSDSNVYMANGNAKVNVAALGTLSKKIIINGSPRSYERTTGSTVVAKGKSA